MSLSIEELDATVRAFYEGRGETVRTCNSLDLHRIDPADTSTSPTAKASASNPQPGRLLRPDPVRRSEANIRTVQGESRCMALGRQDLAGGTISADQM